MATSTSKCDTGKRKDFERWQAASAEKDANEGQSGDAFAWGKGDGSVAPPRDAASPPVNDFTSAEKRRAIETSKAPLPAHGVHEKPVSLYPITSYDRGFQHGASWGTDHVKMLKISGADYSKRPARRQKERDDHKLQAPEGCNELNIWFGRYIGEQWRDRMSMTAALHRCCVRRDAGRTKADDRFGEAGYCCVFFARGMCSNGEECTFLHRIPNQADEKRLAVALDVFGRERHSTNRDDMRGTGSFNRMSRTLYIGGLRLLRGAEETHKSLLRHMSEWGEVEQLRIIPSKVAQNHRKFSMVDQVTALDIMRC